MSQFKLPVVTVSDEIGLFCLLEQSRLSTDGLANELKVNKIKMAAIIDVLITLKLVYSDGDLLTLTDTAKTFLLPESNYYWGPMLKLAHDAKHKSLASALVNDKSAKQKHKALWLASAMSTERAKEFTDAMHCSSLTPALALAQTGFFDGLNNILDIGGGSGVFCLALLNKYPALKCTLLDLNTVCDIAKLYAERYSLSDRLQFVTGDMFMIEWPSGFDAILFSNVFHNWDVESCEKLCTKSFGALSPGGKLFIHEMILSGSRPFPLTALLQSVNMLLNTEGVQFKEEDLRNILAKSGFSNLQVLNTLGYFSVMYGEKH